MGTGLEFPGSTHACQLFAETGAGAAKLRRYSKRAPAANSLRRLFLVRHSGFVITVMSLSLQIDVNHGWNRFV
jgi:hypothetical protein